MDDSIEVQLIAPVNIALIKYWGKADDENIVPINDSLSITISPTALSSITTITMSSLIPEDCLFINGEKQPISHRLAKVIEILKNRTQGYYLNNKLITKKQLVSMHFKADSTNSFPTAAGLASSASGLCALAYGLCKIYGIKEQFEGETSTIIRRCSGSACRSLFGGYAIWECGIQNDVIAPDKSIAYQLHNEQHWPLKVFILICNDKKKDVASTDAMKISCQTSQLLKYRAKFTAPERMAKLKEAIANKKFDSFARLTIEDSNEFHAICLDSYPPIIYFNNHTISIIKSLSFINSYYKKEIVAYTIDAGPNVVVICEDVNFCMIGKYIEELICKKPADELKKIGLQAIEHGEDIKLITTEIGPGVKIVYEK